MSEWCRYMSETCNDCHLSGTCSKLLPVTSWIQVSSAYCYLYVSRSLFQPILLHSTCMIRFWQHPVIRVSVCLSVTMCTWSVQSGELKLYCRVPIRQATSCSLFGHFCILQPLNAQKKRNVDNSASGRRRDMRCKQSYHHHLSVIITTSNRGFCSAAIPYVARSTVGLLNDSCTCTYASCFLFVCVQSTKLGTLRII